MARDIRPKAKLMKRFGTLVEEATTSKRKSRKKSDHGSRLEEKQKLKFVYGILERQFKRYIHQALRTNRNPRETLLKLLETRLDNVVYQLGFTPTRPSARQLVSHGHIYVDGKKVTASSYSVRPKQTITIDESMRNNLLVKKSTENKKSSEVPSWLRREYSEGIVDHIPAEDELPKDIKIEYILELYF